MKIQKTKIMKSVLPVLAFLTSISAAAKTTCPQVLQQDPIGPEPPPGVPIDSYLVYMFIFALLLGTIYFFKKEKSNS